MLKKFLFVILTIFVTNIYSLAYEPCLPKGTLIFVNSNVPINTENLEEGSIMYFIVPNDVWILEKKAISKGMVFKGHVSMLRMPIQGINATLKIEIDELIDVENKTKEQVKGKLIFLGSEVLGGTLTNPKTYNTTIHPRKVYGNHWGGTLQYVRSGEYEFGQHVKLNQRDRLFVQLDEDYYIN